MEGLRKFPGCGHLPAMQASLLTDPTPRLLSGAPTQASLLSQHLKFPQDKPERRDGALFHESISLLILTFVQLV